MSTVSQPIRRKSQKTLQKLRRAKALNKREPSAIQDFRNAVKNLLLDKLYRSQFLYWNDQLKALSKENALSQGRADDGINYAVFWHNRRYTPVNGAFADVDRRAYCMELNPRIREYAARMEEIAEELDALQDERYEAERFIANAFTFDAPAHRFATIFGDMLFDVIRPLAEAHCVTDSEWDDNQDVELATYVEANREVIRKMQERLMLNLVT